MLYEYSDNKLGDKDGAKSKQQSDHPLKPWLSKSLGNLRSQNRCSLIIGCTNLILLVVIVLGVVSLYVFHHNSFNLRAQVSGEVL